MKLFPGGIEEICSRVLCKRHNAELSPLDDEAGKLRDVGVFARNGTPGGLINVDGPLFTRWCMKCMMGHLAAGWTHQLGKVTDPPENLLQIVFGNDSAVDQYGGLYVSADTTKSSGYCFNASVDILMGLRPDGRSEIAGATITLHRMVFFLWLQQTPIPRTFIVDGRLGSMPTTPETLQFRPKTIRFSSPSDQLIVRFAWPPGVPCGESAEFS